MFGSRVGLSGSADRMALFRVISNPRWRLAMQKGHDIHFMLRFYGRVFRAQGGATIFKVGVQVRERSVRKNFFDPPTFGLPGGHKTGYYSFHYCNYDV